MRIDTKWMRLLGLFAILATLAFVAAGCGGGEEEGAEETTGTTGTAGGGGITKRTFPEFTIIFDTGLDYLDPGLSYTVQGWETMWNVYLSLLGYKHTAGPEGATLVPALAEDLPEVSSDGLTYKLKLRQGLKYSNGKAVKASDFKYTIKRLFQIESPGVGFFTNIAGADQFSKLEKAQMKTADISGITTNDSTRDITIKLAKPQGDFQNILATIFAAPVPSGTPVTDQSTHPIPSTGPYMIQSYRPNRGFTLVRNPNFQETDDVPATNPDKMTFKIVEDDTAALQQVLNGQADYDFHKVPVDRLANVQQQHGDQLKIFTPANTYYFFMNTRLAPFNNLKVRQAVNYGIDRQALVRLYGGLAAPTQNILPPTYPQYKKLNLYPHDVAKAKQLLKEAGADGAQVTVWGSNRDTVRPIVAYLNDALNQIGFKSKLKIIDASIYWTTIGNQKTKAQIGFADWFQDYPHPLDWFDVLLNGNRITPTHNNNYSNADVPAINNKIEQLKKEPELTDDINSQWAELDRKAMEQALWAPYVNQQFTDFFDTDIDLGSCYINHVLYQFDFGRICKK